MTPTDHYLLHPVAWAVCQEVLEEESAMIHAGRTAEERSSFLDGELNRIVSSAPVTLREAYAELLSSWNIESSQTDLNHVKRRARLHHSHLTFRESRNRLRQMGIPDNSLATPLIIVGLMLISDDDDVVLPLRRLFHNRIQSLVDHPNVAASNDQYLNIIQADGLLPSEREQRIIALGQEVFAGMLDDVADLITFHSSEYRDLAIVRGALLDLGIADLIETAIAHGFLKEVRDILMATADAGIVVYRGVVIDILSKRIDAIRSAQGAHTTDDPEVDLRPKAQPRHVVRSDQAPANGTAF